MALRILIANVTLATRTGTETASRDLALGLLAAGHHPVVYSRHLGAIADDMRASGITVVSDLARLPAAPDVIHGNHHVETMDALFHFPGTPCVFVCHDRTAPWSAPVCIDRIRHFVAVDRYCLERLTGDYGIAPARTRVIYNAVDTGRFAQRPPLPPQPRRALVFSNYAGPGTHLQAAQEACALAGLELDVLGASAGNDSLAPEHRLADYDVVFAKARCALEAMAVGASVVLCDTSGLGPMVTRANVEHLRPWNFGRRLLREPVEPERILARLHEYDADDARAVSDYIRQHAHLSDNTAEYIQLYADTLAEAVREPRGLADDLTQYVMSAVTRIGTLEEALARLSTGRVMEPLPDDACASMRLQLTDCPDAVSADDGFSARVELTNAGEATLASHPPCPVHLSYRWLTATGDGVLVADGRRTLLRPSSAPGTSTSYSMRVHAPAEAGVYRLRVTLVQETVVWFDTVARPLWAEAVVRVTPSRPGQDPPAATQRE